MENGSSRMDNTRSPSLLTLSLVWLVILTSCSSQPIFGSIGTSDQLIAVGWMGSIWSSRDGGKTWIDEENPTVETLNSITQDSDGTRYAAAEKGIVLQQRPNQAWEYAKIPSIKAYLTGAFADPRGVFIVGESGTILFSKDKGQSWKTKTVGKNWLRDIKGDAQGLYAVGYQGTFLCSFDAGESWAEATTNTTESLHGVWGDGQGNLYAVGVNGTIVKSSDRCKSFQTLSSQTKRTLYEITGRSPSEIYAVGNGGVILRSVNQGQSWEAIESGTQQELYTIAQSNGKLFALGSNRTVVEVKGEW